MAVSAASAASFCRHWSSVCWCRGVCRQLVRGHGNITCFRVEAFCFCVDLWRTVAIKRLERLRIRHAVFCSNDCDGVWDFFELLYVQTGQAVCVRRSIAERSCNHCCSEKAISVTHSEYVFCSLNHPVCNAHAPYCHLWSVRPYSIFPHYLTKGTIFEK